MISTDCCYKLYLGMCVCVCVCVCDTWVQMRCFSLPSSELGVMSIAGTIVKLHKPNTNHYCIKNVSYLQDRLSYHQILEKLFLLSLPDLNLKGFRGNTSFQAIFAVLQPSNQATIFFYFSSMTKLSGITYQPLFHIFYDSL